uniref:Zf-RVT domain-containing protein n=1 Tax=Haemonchus contortus TaxID=6289 RepID=A0A7I4YRD6_HAECO
MFMRLVFEARFIKDIEGIVTKTKNIRLCAHLFDTAFRPFCFDTRLRDLDRISMQLASFNALGTDYARNSPIHVGRAHDDSDDRWIGRLRTGYLWTTNEHQYGRRDGETFSRKLWIEGTFCPVCLERVGFTEVLWLATETEWTRHCRPLEKIDDQRNDR